MTPRQPFESIVGKIRNVENAGNQHFLLFPKCFLPYQREIVIWATFILSSANAFNLVMPKILSFAKEFNLCHIVLTINDPEKEGFLKHF